MEILGVFNDVLLNETANEVVAEMIREKIRSDRGRPATAETLCPRHPFGSNAVPRHELLPDLQPPHVRLVDLRNGSIASITEDGDRHGSESFEFEPSSTPPVRRHDRTDRRGRHHGRDGSR